MKCNECKTLKDHYIKLYDKTENKLIGIHFWVSIKTEMILANEYYVDGKPFTFFGLKAYCYCMKCNGVKRGFFHSFEYIEYIEEKFNREQNKQIGAR